MDHPAQRGPLGALGLVHPGDDGGDDDEADPGADQERHGQIDDRGTTGRRRDEGDQTTSTQCADADGSRLDRLGMGEIAFEVEFWGTLTSRVDEPGFEWTGIQSSAEPAERSGRHEHGETLAKGEDQALDHQHQRRRDQHLPSPENVGEATRRQFEERGCQAVDGEHDADAREIQAACLEQQDEHRDLETDLEPAQRQQPQKAAPQHLRLHFGVDVRSHPNQLNPPRSIVESSSGRVARSRFAVDRGDVDGHSDGMTSALLVQRRAVDGALGTAVSIRRLGGPRWEAGELSAAANLVRRS